MTLTELQEKRGRLVTEARAALDEIKKNTDEARAAELEARHDAIMADFDKVEKNIEREERQAAIEARFEQRRKERRPGSRSEDRASGSDAGDELSYRSVFYKFIATGADLAALEPEERAVLKAGVQLGEEYRAQSSATGSAGGYTVPTELADILIKSMKAFGPMYDPGVTTEINTTSGAVIQLPTIDDTSGTAYAHTQGADIVDDGSADAVFGQKQLEAYVYDTKFIKFSMELAQDSIFNIEALLGDLLGERLGRLANLQLTVGTGTSAPNGVATASTQGKVAASATAIASDEIIDLVHSVDAAYRQSPKVGFQFNDTTLSAIRKLKDGQGNYLWQMGDVTKGQPGALLGYRYDINQAVANIATGNRSMLFGDFSKYFVRKVGSPVIGVMRERFWPNLGIAGYIRFDGELADTAAIKHLKQA
jgi:HK97 family phage major capsid protein